MPTQDLQDKLVRLRSRTSEARALFDAVRGTNPVDNVTKVDHLAGLTRLSPKQIRDVFGVLERYGIGTLVLGRKGHPTRFEWSVPPRTLPGRQPGEPEPADALGPAGGEVLRSNSATVWVVKLSPKTFAHVVLPPNVEASDIEALRDYCDAHLEALSHRRR